MKNKLSIKLKSILKASAIFVFICMIPSCMNMKHGSKSSKVDRGLGVVWIRYDNFSPDSIIVPVYTTVTWTNKDLWHHTVTSDAGLFDSGNIKGRGTFSYKFTAAGTYNYHCNIHSHMVAKVIVK